MEGKLYLQVVSIMTPPYGLFWLRTLFTHSNAAWSTGMDESPGHWESTTLWGVMTCSWMGGHLRFWVLVVSHFIFVAWTNYNFSRLCCFYLYAFLFLFLFLLQGSIVCIILRQILTFFSPSFLLTPGISWFQHQRSSPLKLFLFFLLLLYPSVIPLSCKVEHKGWCSPGWIKISLFCILSSWLAVLITKLRVRKWGFCFPSGK